MGMFSWLFAQRSGSVGRASGEGGDLRETHVANLQGPGTFSLEVVGESHYQRALEKICGGRTEHGHEFECVATLVQEDDNPHDKNAVRVDIEGRTVGYLSRELAPQIRRALADVGYPGFRAQCAALIVGGWDRGSGDKGHFGVRLDIPMDN